MVTQLLSPFATGCFPWDEDARLRALDSYGILDTPREADFDDVAALAAATFGTPIAVVNLIAEGRQWFKAEIGIGARELPLDVSICAHAFLESRLMVVPDTTEDPRFACNPLVAVDGGLRFYAGVLLRTVDGLPLGTLCVLDTVPRPDGITALQRMTLEVLGRQIMTQLELRRMLMQRQADEKELRESETRARLALDAAELGAWEAVPGTGVLYGDARARELLGHAETAEMPFDAFLAHVHPDDSAAFAGAVATALADGGDNRLDIEYRVRPTNGSGHRWLRSRAQVLKAPGERRRLVGTVRDISAEKAAEEHRRLLNNELQHRVRNTLGVVQGIVSQSLRAVATPAEASAAISSRLITLAHAHDLLTQTSWVAAPIAAIIEGAVLVHLADSARVSIAGPPIELKARAALALSMALHELFTNAVKYGALSNDVGTVAIDWAITPGSSPGVELTWREQGGPPVVPPTRTGFGTRLTGSSLAGDLGGTGVTEYAPAGVRWSLSTTIAAICELDGA
ncbi:sensor histidine kinase [Sandarakinorhabdus sp. DWP1-3-1]|uniref:sensor histidine kinase n=1 Tax=Sandarakinorhabdus sp. DWP1-3-1 TaxID=2804627 RepID=UPI003CEA6D8D